MRDFACPHRGERLAFETSVCLSCSNGVGFEQDGVGVPINDRREDPQQGLAFDVLSSHQDAVTTGHDSGVVTLDLAEGDDLGASYPAALDRHYSQEVPAGWESDCVSSYAAMYPAEDWVEDWAHYLHIRNAVGTAATS